MQARGDIIGALEIFTGRSTNMAQAARAKSKTTPIELTVKQVLEFSKLALDNFHPRTGPMKQLALDVKIKKRSDVPINIPNGKFDVITVTAYGQEWALVPVALG
jgi:hypothetical protein